MSYLRLVRAPQALPLTDDDACLNAFREHVDYVYRSLQRLGAAPSSGLGWGTNDAGGNNDYKMRSTGDLYLYQPLYANPSRCGRRRD